MKCPECKLEQFVVYDTRPIDEGVIRRKRCMHCGRKVKTLEIIVPDQFKHKEYLNLINETMQRKDRN